MKKNVEILVDNRYKGKFFIVRIYEDEVKSKYVKEYNKLSWKKAFALANSL